MIYIVSHRIVWLITDSLFLYRRRMERIISKQRTEVQTRTNQPMELRARVIRAAVVVRQPDGVVSVSSIR